MIPLLSKESRCFAICLVLHCGILPGLHAQASSTSEASSRLEGVSRLLDIQKKVLDLDRERNQKSDAAKFLEGYSLTYKADPGRSKKLAELDTLLPYARGDQDVRDILAADEKELEKNPHPQEKEQSLDSARLLILKEGPFTTVRRLSSKGDTFTVTADGVNVFDVPRDKLLLHPGRQDVLAVALQKQREAAELNQLETMTLNTITTITQQAAHQQQQQGAEMQRQQREVEVQRQVPTETKPAYSRSQEGVPEHTYELLQDYTIVVGDLRRRLRRGERYHGRILIDHAEIDIDGISYRVPSGILWPRD
jgi:hypothetical protein